MTDIYEDQFTSIARTSFTMWNRDPASPSFGSLDRQYWGWKYKDFSDATMQYAAGLAIRYAMREQKTSTLPPLLEGYIEFCAQIQLPDGSFNQCYPYERSPGVLYDFLSTLIFVRTSGLVLSAKHQSMLDVVMERGVDFVLRTDERHGNVSNHVAQYAFELLNYASYSGNAAAQRKGVEYVERLLSWFDRAEGWFLEYNGPDTGYQTRTLRYLVKIAAILDKGELWDIARAAAGYVEQTMMPDGSIHPMLGCRSTALLYPSAFEVLGAKYPDCANVAERVRSAWRHRRVPLPTDLDFGNAIRLADDALDASGALGVRQDTAALELATVGLPVGHTDYPAAGISIRRDANRIVYIGHKLGGVVVIYARTAGGPWKLVHEDSGYLIKSFENSTTYCSRLPGSGELTEATETQLHVEARFFRSLHDEMTPGRMVILRLMNLSFLRIQWVADLFRKVVVRHLMTEKDVAPFTLRRNVTLAPDAVTITDMIDTGDAAGNFVSTSVLYSCRRLTAAHMASSRYFQSQELEETRADWMKVIPWPTIVGHARQVAISTGPTPRLP